LTGFLSAPGAVDDAEAIRRLEAMTSAIRRRGPDASGHWHDPEAGIGLGHRRLSILDLSAAGAQPMPSRSGRYVLAFNGEIYNHLELRARLEAEGLAPDWRGHSDTETLCAGFEAWGIEKTVCCAIGMFAFASWDRKVRLLTLARDRMGEKPLAYGWQGAGADAAFLFGSDLGALRAHPACLREIDRDALVHFMRHSCLGGELSIYRGVRKVPPGAMVEVSLEDRTPRVRRYWSVAGAIAGTRDTPQVSEAERVDALDDLLRDAVRRQMLSDVPVGAFLSGGVDSSLVVALMQEFSDRPVRTFAIGFHSQRYDEAGYAAAVAAHLGTDHTELYVGERELLEVVPRLPEIFDEPFADGSQVPTVLVSKLARESVTVSLSGDGGDELFAGYDRYRQGAGLARWMHRVPLPLRALAAGGVRAAPPRLLSRAFDPFLSVAEGKEPNGQRLRRLADYLRSGSSRELHRKLVSRWRFPEQVVLDAREPDGVLTEPDAAFDRLEDAELMMALDLGAYLPDDILAKVDRASMSVSLESRAPLLDHRVVEFALDLPLEMKLRGGISKWALRQVLYRRVPQNLIERPKMGFEAPVAEWLRGPLREWAATLLSSERLRREGFLDPVVIERKWGEHLSGNWNWGMQLWNVVMFQSWLEAERAGI